jgi:hypothetical protein
MTIAAASAADALMVLSRQIRRMPHLEVVDLDESPGALRMAIDVRRTGLSGYGVVRRLSDGHGLRLEARADRIVARFRSRGEICDQGTRLLFALAAMATPAVSPRWS